ncbi:MULTISPECIES: stage V sporulation protein AD [Clostridium]|uniref:Stage V sporulation protein AD n=1 Tax=Clostridium ragsdalei P11 TaxID=1353534 RepID=A0A1A6AUA6_9CLOT|nr:MULTISPECIES: stage V sporulation protein AD [Clostridium]OBR93610.1 stage V sporulation protein AD [Clostridium ragsdalei P11]QXE17366.1 stage V sporulation protein AD [Clostridium sp. 001]QXE17412.1 stage V sporulation protein AD [Clostridium sp. 001]
MIQGHQSWVFESKPTILGCGAVGGPFEAKGALAKDFDLLHEDIWLGQDSFEKSEKKLLEEACQIAIKNAKVKKESINFFISGDLMNQIVISSFAARTLSIPYLGIFGACSSSMEGLAISSLLIDNGAAEYVLCGTSSHNAATEKQFRYPTEYGGQKPPTAQWTVTGAGAAVVGKGTGPKVTSATIGKVVDMGISDPFNMGAAMAAAAVDTIEAHFRDLNRDPSYYDIIATGDLGKIGHDIAEEILKKDGFKFQEGVFKDCGKLIYNKDQPVFSGGSGCACSATVTYGHFFKEMKKKKLNKILVVATGALMSPMSYQQKESIPSVAHAVSIEA